VLRITRRAATLGTLSALAGSTLAPLARAGLDSLDLGEGAEEFWLATDAYVFGYPLVTMEITRRVMTNVATVEKTRGPMGQFVRAHPRTEMLAYFESVPGSIFDLATKPASKAAYRRYITPLG